MALTAADVLIETIQDWGVEVVFGLPGDGIMVVQGVVDPFEPPLPAKVTLEQAAKFAKSLRRGEPNSQKIALTVLGDRIRELV